MSYPALGCAVITQAVKDLTASKWQISPNDKLVAIEFLTKPNDLLKFYCDLADLNMPFIVETATKIQAYILEHGVPKGIQGSELVKSWGERLRLPKPIAHVIDPDFDDNPYVETVGDLS